jgi:O-antigen ligase
MLPAVIMIGRKHSILGISVFALLALVLAKTHSTSGLIFAAMLVTVLCICRLLPKLLHNEFFLFAILGVGCCAVIAFALNTHFDQITLLLGKDATLSGRTQIWEGAVQAIAKHPLLGYGFSAFWLGLKGESANIVLATRWLAPAAHNGFLDLCLQLGLAGLLTFAVALFRGCASASYCLLHGGGEAAEWCAGIMLLTITYNLDESSLMIPGELLWVLFTVAFITARDLAAAKRFAEQVYRQRFAITSPNPEFLTVTA